MELLLPVVLGALAAAGAALVPRATPAIVSRLSRGATTPSGLDRGAGRASDAATLPAESRRSGSGRVLLRVAAERPFDDAASARDAGPLTAARDALQPRPRPNCGATILAEWERDVPAVNERSSAHKVRQVARRNGRPPVREAGRRGQPSDVPAPSWPDAVAAAPASPRIDAWRTAASGGCEACAGASDRGAAFCGRCGRPLAD
jgi:hypothetical protein